MTHPSPTRTAAAYEVTGREWELVESSPYVTLSVALRPSED